MNRRTKLALARDKNIKAQHAGKRTSADGNTYYEYRENRSDVNRTKRFAKGGSIKQEFLEHPLLIERRSDGTLDVDFDSNNSTGWRYSTDDIGEAVAIMINSKYDKNPKVREIAITPKQLKKSDEKTIVYWLSGGNKAWRFNQADYKHSFDKTYADLWEKDAKKIKKEILKLKNIGEVMDFYYKEYLEYPHFYSDALENGYVIDEEDEDYAKGGGVGNSFSEDTNSWYDLVADKSEELENDERLLKAIDICNKEATRENLEKLREVIKTIPYSRNVRNLLDNQISNILSGKYRGDFKNLFGGKRKGFGKVSATSEFFSLFVQSASYNFEESIYAKGGEISEDRINEVLDNYMIAALWSSTDMDTEEPLDANYSVSDIAPATRERMYKDVKMFIEDNYDAIEASGSSDEQLGHDLWLSRNGHGAGFFDRGYGDVGDKLQDAARDMKGVDLEVGDDGMIHQLGVFKKGGSLKRSKLAISRDKSVKALHGGKRVSAEGNVYYENRENRSDVNRTKKFAEGGSLKGTSQSDLEETAKYMTNAVKKHSWDLKDLIFYFEKDNDFDYKVRAKIWEEKNVYEMPKTYNNILELLKEIVDGNQGSTKSDKMANGGELTEKEQDLKSKIEAILDKVVPNFYHRVWIHKNFLGDGYNLGILIAASDKTINQVRGQFPQVVSLNLDLSSLELHPQIFGGNGGQSIYRNPNMNDPKEQYLAMKSVKIPFRTPAKEEGAVLKAIEKFAENYKKTLKENIDVLRYTDIVDYDALLSAKKMENGGDVGDFEQKLKDAFKQTNKWHFLGGNINGHEVQIKVFVGVKECDVQIFKKDGLHVSLGKNYVGKRETMKMIMDALENKFESGGGLGDKMSFEEFSETLRDHEIEGGFGKTLEKGYIMYYLPNNHPYLNTKFLTKNKENAYKEYLKMNKHSDGGKVSNERYIFGIEYKATPTSRVFKKSSLTMSGKDTKEMNDAISNNAELLKKQEGWFEVRTTKTPILKEGGKLDLSKHLHSGRYISLDITPNGNLKITLDEDGRAEVLEMRDDDRNDDYIMSELFDDVRGNSELMYFDDIGAQGFGLTEAPAITDGFYYDDNGNLTDEGHDDSQVYFFERYMIDSFIDTMLEDGYVIFDRVSKSKKMAKGGRVTKNEDVLESFLESNEQVNVKNLSTHYNEHDKEVLLRNYFTLIATRKGMDVKITSKKYSQTTSTIQNKLKSLAAKKGFNIIEVEEFEEGGTIGDSELKSLERSLRSSLSSGKEISEEDLETYLGRELKSEEEVVGYNVRRCFLKPYYKKIK